MQDLRITLVQADQAWENKEANFTNYADLLQGVETDLILLPEMFQTGFSMNTDELKEDWSDSASLQWLKTMSKEKNAAIYTSLIIDDNGVYNRGVFVTPLGEVHVYDKRKTFTLAREHEHFSNGEKETIVEYKDWRFQLQICYDLRFPEIVRNRIESNQSPAYDVILYVANWPEKRAEHWKALIKARAIENQCFVAAANRSGSDAKGLSYSGDSAMIDPLGNVEMLEKGKETVSTFVINRDHLMKIREMLPFLNDR